MIVYEPTLEEEAFFRSNVVRDLQAFKQEADFIVVNRITGEIQDVQDKLFTRDLFGNG